ncbi:hypothetical protein CAC42_335 [Sphaceloma murrayae]|uniref:Transcription factor IIIC 90kDa subunit N-terminal domain-containing protein n=1 Tax=Sphaceloma murrayae TaxID=2082308 RepID=A0A2K1QZZ2_9PEZI|nr:hypothetical protein CAC42_335 [Sphaceloma murrayae]
MDEVVLINGWPSSPDCMAWSHDNVIAVGVRDGVVLIAPRSEGRSETGSFWRAANLDAGDFPFDDVPLREPLPWSNFSVGQELSERHVVSLQWSPPGLGSFARSVLAVLSANEVLSLYDCDGRLDVKEFWHRRLVVNHALGADENPEINHFSRPRQHRSEWTERSHRIRSFCWIPPPHAHRCQMPLRARSTFRNFMLAICDDNDMVQVLEVRSPHDVLNPDRDTWEINTLYSFSAAPISSHTGTVSSFLPSSFSQPSSGNVDQLSWSPWSFNVEGNLVSTLVYTYNAVLHAISVEASWQSSRPDHFRIISHDAPEEIDHLRVRGPLRWLPAGAAGDGADDTLVYYSDAGLNRLDIDHERGSAVRRQLLYASDSCWTSVAGLASFTRKDDGKLLCLSPQMLDWNPGVIVTAVDATSPTVHSAPAWAGPLSRTKNAYNKSHHMTGNISTHVHGLASSPFGNTLGLCASFHPREGLEYVIPAHAEGYVVIAQEWEPMNNGNLSLSIGSAADTHGFAAENIATLLHGIKDHPDLPDPDLIEAQFARSLSLTGAPDDVVAAEPLAREDLAGYVHRLRSSLLFSSESVQIRLKHLISIALGRVELPAGPDVRTLKSLVTLTTDLSTLVSDDDELSRQLLHTHRKILSELSSRELGIIDTAEGDKHHHYEKCSVCSAEIPFES